LRDGQRHMAPPHRLAVELSDQMESISQIKQTRPRSVKETIQGSQNYREAV
jgi:hypothetical protein